MSKVDLNRIPKWELGKWYFFTKFKEWGSLTTTNQVKDTYYTLRASVFKEDYERTFTPNGLHILEDSTRTLLEPWEALEMYPECKDTAPDGVDWSVPVECLELPKCLIRNEFDKLDHDVLFYFNVDEGIYENSKSDYNYGEGESENESGFYLSKEQAQTFKRLYEAGRIEFVDGTWKMKSDGMPTPEAQPLPENLFVQNRALLARNAELKEEINTLNCNIYNLENPVDFTDHDTEAKLKAENSELKATCSKLQYLEAENKELKTENEQLKTGNKMYAKSWSKQANEISDLEDRVADLEETVNVLKQRLEVANGIIGDLTITMKIREV